MARAMHRPRHPGQRCTTKDCGVVPRPRAPWPSTTHLLGCAVMGRPIQTVMGHDFLVVSCYVPGGPAQFSCPLKP